MGQKLRSHATIMVPIPRGESPILFYPLEVDLGSLFLSIFVPKQWALVLLLSRDGICSLWWEISKQKDAISYFNLPKETESRDREKGQNLADFKESIRKKAAKLSRSEMVYGYRRIKNRGLSRRTFWNYATQPNSLNSYPLMLFTYFNYFSTSIVDLKSKEQIRCGW